MNDLYIIARKGDLLEQISGVTSIDEALQAGRMWLTKNPDFQEETAVFPVATLEGYGFYYYVQSSKSAS